MEQPCCKVVTSNLSESCIRGYAVRAYPIMGNTKDGGGAISIYEILSLLFFGGNFLITLPTYIDRNNKHK